MNAIILAAGLGTRMRPLTDDRPKCMVEVCGEPIIERQIRLLRDKGINDIIIVSGYMAHSLDYLINKYNIRIINNPEYDTSNNIYSLYVAQEYFGDSYIIEGDVFIRDNCLKESLDRSTYFATAKQYNNEWGLVCEDGHLKSVNIGSGNGPIMSGISYWTKADAQIIRDHINYLVGTGNYQSLFWDNAVIDKLDRLPNIKVETVEGLFEVDTVSELHDLERIIRQHNGA